MNINQLKKSRFLTQNDCEPPILLTITGAEEMNVAQEGADPDMRICLHFQEVEKPLVLNSTNGQIIAAITGTGDLGEDGNNWNDTKIVLYRDPNISWGGKITGGIRVRAPKPKAPTQQNKKPTPPPADDIPF